MTIFNSAMTFRIDTISAGLSDLQSIMYMIIIEIHDFMSTPKHTPISKVVWKSVFPCSCIEADLVTQHDSQPSKQYPRYQSTWQVSMEKQCKPLLGRDAHWPRRGGSHVHQLAITCVATIGLVRLSHRPVLGSLTTPAPSGLPAACYACSASRRQRR